MRTKKSVRRHKTAAQKAAILARYELSGLSARDFAAQRDISPSTLKRWAQRSKAKAAASRTRLVEVPNLFAAGSGVAPYRVRLPRGLVLEVASGFKASELQSLVQLLQNL
jgi:transposase-like protein